jgi:hypothetical protein
VPRARLVGQAGLGRQTVGGLAPEVFRLGRRDRHLILPIHFPTPTVGLITSDGERFNYRFKRD